MKERCAVKQRQRCCCPASLTSEIKAFMLVMLRAAARVCLALRHPGWHLPRTMKEHAVKQRQQRHCPASLTSDIKAFLLIVQPRVAACIHCAPRHLGWPLPHNMKECAIKKNSDVAAGLTGP